MQPFDQATYLAQVRRLRTLAASALGAYPVSVRAVDFIQHGENATFRVTDAGGRRFLLRIHRPGYHTDAGIAEELRWLRRLAGATELMLPAPIRSRRERWVETASAPGIPTPRACTLLGWVEGRFVRHVVTPRHLFALGGATARLHRKTSQIPAAHRRYWDADGLVGAAPKFGRIDALAGVSRPDQQTLSDARRLVHRRLREFEKTSPDLQGFIHADLHFGNILFAGGRLGVIDFDDCGLGFYAYDLAVSITAIERALGEAGKDRLAEYTGALIEGYAAQGRWDARSDRILSWLVSARKLLMLGWLQSRSDNPRIRAHLPKAVGETIRRLETSSHL